MTKIKTFIDTLYNVLLAPDLYDGLFPLLCYWIWDIPAFFIKGFAQFSLVTTNRTRQHYRTAHREIKHFWYKQRKSQNYKRKYLKRRFFGMITSEIRAHIQKITTGRRYRNVLARNLFQGISWPIMHIMSDRHLWMPSHLKMGAHGNHTIHIYQKFNKRHYFC